MKNLKTFISWSAIYAIICCFDSYLFYENFNLSLFEIVWHSLLIGLLMMVHQHLKNRNAKRPFFEKTYPKWQFKVFYGFSFGMFMSFGMLFLETDEQIILSLTSPKFYIKMFIYIVVFTFIAGHLSKDEYKRWGFISE